MITLAELGSTRTSSAGHLVDPGQQLVGRGVERLPARHDVGAELGEEPLEAAPGGNRQGAAAPALSRSRRSATCSRMSATSRLVTSPTPSKRATAASGSSVCTWTLRVASSPTTRTESPRPSSRGRCRRASEAAAGDDEVRAVAEAAVLVVGQAEARRLLVRDLRHRGVPPQAGDDAGQDQDQAVAAGVDDAGFAQHLELLGCARPRAGRPRSPARGPRRGPRPAALR